MITETIYKCLTLDTTNHKGSQVVLIKFSKDKVLDEVIKTIKGVRWTMTHKCWQVTYSVSAINQIKTVFDPICKIDATLLKEKILSKKAVPTIVSLPATLVISDDAKTKMK